MSDLRKFLWLGLISVIMIVIGTILMFGAGCVTKRPPPHRPLSQIDIQGHMELLPERPCPAVYDAPEGNLRFCLP